jgi:hypothetical protein
VRHALIVAIFVATLGAQTTLSDARAIARSSIAATERNWCARIHYNYIERDETQRLGPDGRLQSRDVSLSRIITLDGIPFEQLMEHNGRPPSPEEKRKQDAELEKLKRETLAERAVRLRKEKQETAALTHDVLEAFDYRLTGTEPVNGRVAYVLQATPRPGYRAESKYGKMFSKVEGKIWVDREDMVWVKVEGHVEQPFSMGLFLARVLRGTRIMMEQTRVTDGIWLPRQVEVRANAKILFVKSLSVDRILSYSGFRPVTATVAAATP